MSVSVSGPLAMVPMSSPTATDSQGRGAAPRTVSARTLGRARRGRRRCSGAARARGTCPPRRNARARRARSPGTVRRRRLPSADRHSTRCETSAPAPPPNSLRFSSAPSRHCCLRRLTPGCTGRANSHRSPHRYWPMPARGSPPDSSPSARPSTRPAWPPRPQWEHRRGDGRAPRPSGPRTPGRSTAGCRRRSRWRSGGRHRSSPARCGSLAVPDRDPIAPSDRLDRGLVEAARSHRPLCSDSPLLPSRSAWPDGRATATGAVGTVPPGIVGVPTAGGLPSVSRSARGHGMQATGWRWNR